MKKLSLLILSLFIFSGCIWGNEKPETDIEIVSDDYVPQNAEETLDNDAILQAVSLQNAKICDTIKSGEQREFCITRVADQFTLDKAVADADMGACAKIKGDLFEQRCEILVEEKMADLEKEKVLQEEQEEMGKIIESGDVAGCADLNDPNFRTQCETNIYLMKAEKEQNSSYCENITEERVKAMCQAQINE